MITLCIRYKFNPEKIEELRIYAEAEQGVIERNGGKIVGYYFPTDYAGPTDEAMGLIDLPSLAAYEDYRAALAADPEHKKNLARLLQSGAAVAMNRTIVSRIRHEG